MKYLKFFHLNYLTGISPDADYFREDSFLVTSMLAGIAAWLWVGQTVAKQAISAGQGLFLFAFIGISAWLIYRWRRERYFRATLVFLLAQIAFFTIMIYLLKELGFGYLFLFSVFTAGAMIGPAGALGAASLSAVAELILAGTAANAEILPGLILLQYLAALISGQAARGLYAALEAAENLAMESRAHAAEARQHRAELHRTLKSLDMAYLQLERVNGELIQAHSVANSALNFKKQFVAQTSHELRTPLNLIVGFSETMAFSQHSYGVKLPTPYLRDVTEIHRNSRHLLTLIDDILDLSKLESGRMGLNFSLVDIQEIFQSVYDTMKPLTQAKGLALGLDVPASLPRLWLDQARIHQVLLNLLTNAARLTRQGTIQIRAEFRKNQNDLLIQVRDSGPGIPADLLASIFEEFQQTDKTSGAPGTTGLGLTISKRIVELHGGRLWAESVIDQGSVFSFTLPAYMPVGPTKDIPVQSPATQPSIILLSDEGADDLGLLQRHLDGYVLTNAPSWETARQLAGKLHARALITGLESVPDEPFPIPVIICPLPSLRENAESLGVSAYLRKPLTLKALRNAIHQNAPEAKKLLLVDEDARGLRLAERMALGLGKKCRILRAYDGRETLAQVRKHQPDAILLDLGLANYRELLRQIKDLTECPILALSDMDENIPDRPICITNPEGFTANEVLKYLQSVLSAIPPR